MVRPASPKQSSLGLHRCGDRIGRVLEGYDEAVAKLSCLVATVGLREAIGRHPLG